ncbi:MAG: DivIVA domain-containing protein [Actinomycetota bacterium]
MSSTDLDLPVFSSPEQIRRRQFVTTRRGYDPDQVREYLGLVARQVERMEEVIRGVRLGGESTAHARPPAPDAYEELASRLAGLVRAAEGEAERMRREASEEADRTLREARADADRIRLDAQAKAEEAREAAERALQDARERADRTIAGLEMRRNDLTEQLSTMQARLLGVARELESAIERRDETVTITDIADTTDTADSVDVRAPQPATAAKGGSEELWTGTETFDLSIPDIPPLDLRWDDEEG